MNEAGGRGTNAAGFVLAGGESRRMGRDKALIPFRGRPLVTWALETLRAAGLETRIAGARTALEGLAPVVPDPEPGLGPLSGVCAGLAVTEAPWGVFLPVDLPLLPASLIAFLLNHARITGRAVTLPSVNGFAQTFPAVVERAALPVLQVELAGGRRGCFAAFRTAASAFNQEVSVVPVEYCVQAGHLSCPYGLPAACWFESVNTPQRLEWAMALAAKPAGRARFA